jgi:anti-sigma factor RsiW
MRAEVEHVTCRELVEILTDYLEDALQPGVRAEIERHIVICRGCSTYVEQMRSTIGLLGRIAAASADEADADARGEQLLSMFRAWQGGRA